MKRLVLAVMICGLLAGAAQAQSIAPTSPNEAGDSRYSFHRLNDSFVRLDGRTGAVATCAQGASGWTCQSAPDDRTALETEIGRLQGENATLKRELLSRGLALPSGATPPATPIPPVARAPDSLPDALKPPTEADLEKMKTFIGDVWRKVVDLVATLQRDLSR